MKFEILFSVKVIANDKLKIHLAVLSILTEGEEVTRTAQTNMVSQNQRIGKMSKQTKCNILELWRNWTLLNRLHKTKEEVESQIER